MEPWFIGIDGGGTRTRAVVLDSEGDELGRGEGSAALVDPHRPERAAEALAETARETALKAGLELPCAVLWAAVAGAGRETVRSSVEMALDKMDVARRVSVGSDAEAAFYAAFGEGIGILLVAGTGSVAWGRNQEGQEGRVGGWGTLLGDEGSGYAIGLDSLRRVARNVDGRSPETQLLGAILAHLGMESAEDLIGWAAQAEKAEIAALAPVVADSERRGDSAAGEILVKAGEELIGHVLTVVTKLGPWTFPPRVALAGGLLERGGSLRRAVEVALSEHHLQVLPDDVDAALGAARKARETAEEAAS